MPPEGYDTVTLPTDVVEQIDERVEAGAYESRAEALRAALDSGDLRMSARVEAINDGVIDDLAARVAAHTADEVEGRMR